MGRTTRQIALLLGAAMVSGCLPRTGGLDMAGGATIPDSCSDGDRVQAEACDDVYCGAPVALVGTGGSEFEPLDDAGPLSLHFGSNGGSGGYHLFLSVRTENLCPIVWIEPRIEVEIDGAMTTLYEQRLHVLAVRGDPTSSQQDYWGIRAPIPCALWPDDPTRDATCGTFQSRVGHIEDLPLRLSVAAEDQDGRRGHSETWATVACCDF